MDPKWERFARQLKVPEVGEAGQLRLAQASVLVLGAGGLGTPALTYLARAGVGRLGIVDSDGIELANLNRQILYGPQDMGQEKAERAAVSLHTVDPDLKVETWHVQLTADNLPDLVRGWDLVLDAVDNFATKFAISDACVRMAKPLVHAGVKDWQGQVFTYLPSGAHGCLRCLLPATPQDAPPGTHGIIGVTAGLFGVLQAAEALKVLLGKGDLLVDRVLTWDLLTMTGRTLAFQRRPQCPACGGGV